MQDARHARAHAPGAHRRDEADELNGRGEDVGHRQGAVPDGGRHRTSLPGRLAPNGIGVGTGGQDDVPRRTEHSDFGFAVRPVSSRGRSGMNPR